MNLKVISFLDFEHFDLKMVHFFREFLQELTLGIRMQLSVEILPF